MTSDEITRGRLCHNETTSQSVLSSQKRLQAYVKANDRHFEQLLNYETANCTVFADLWSHRRFCISNYRFRNIYAVAVHHRIENRQLAVFTDGTVSPRLAKL